MSAQLMTARVLLREPGLPEVGMIVEALRRIRPQAGELEVMPNEQGTPVYTLEGRRAAIASAEAPLGRSELAQAAAAAWYWPEAAIALADHQAQTLIGVAVEPGRRVETAMTLTALAAAVAEAARAPGIEWPAARLLHSTQAVTQFARQMALDQLPLFVWIDFHVCPEPDGTFSLATRGLEPFGSLEIEVSQSRRDPQTLVGRVYDVAHYVLEKGVILRDGETVGNSQDERITVSVGPSRVDLSRRAVRLDL